MNRIKNYFITQLSRPTAHIVGDFVVVGAAVACGYFAFIH